METTYRLRPNLTWHDGEPLTAQDFTFAVIVYATPSLTRFGSSPQDRIAAVSSPDPRTVVIRWRSLYMDAGTLRARQLDPLPRHILEPIWLPMFASASFLPDAPEQFMNLPYWTQEFVGTGPYKLESWEPGSHLEAVAFDGHALGRPAVERITLRFTSDPDAALAGLLSGSIDIAADGALRFDQAQMLTRDWSDRGVVLMDPVQPRFAHIQFDPDFASPPSLLDQRVRRALAHGLDRPAMLDALFGGMVPPSDQIMPRTVSYFDDLDRSVRKYPYDLRQAEQLMGEAGYRKGGDGVYAADASGERFSFESRSPAGGLDERQGALMASSWRQGGFDAKDVVTSASEAQDGQARASFPGLSNAVADYGDMALATLATEQIPTPFNRWSGANRGAWSNQQYDQLWTQFNATLDRSERNRQVVQMMQVATEDVALIFLYHNPLITAHVAGLRGPDVGPPGYLIDWNIHDWIYPQ
jgi:peptide/nickel transport system substrate-binding protein